MRKLTSLFLLAFSLAATAQTHVMDVNTQKLGAPVPLPTAASMPRW